jgi:MYXO-CTERM domain-containing protein
VQSCVLDGCDEGEACEEDGLCVEAACLGVRCGPGRTCVGGTCADACADAVCPEDEECVRGECRPTVPPVPDAGLPDAGPGDDAGDGDDAGPGMDAGPRTDAGGGTGDGSGCGCRTTGAGGSAGSALLFLLVLGVLVIRRRRS